MHTYNSSRATRWGAPVLVLSALLVAGGCSKDQLLQVQTPDQIVPSSVASPSGAQALWASAVGQFSKIVGGDVGGSFFGLALTEAIFVDEAYSARSGSEQLDSRSQINSTNPETNTWSYFGAAYAQNVRAIRAVNQYPPSATTKTTELGQLYTQQGFMYTLMAEAYCNGIPWSSVNDNSPGSVVLSTAQMYGRAISAFDSALAILSTSATDQQYRMAARIGIARTMVDQDKANLSKAVAVLAAGGDGAGSAAIPTSFAFNAQYSVLTSGVDNSIYDWMFATKNYGASDLEGGNGLNFVSAGDARIHVNPNIVGSGQDGTPTPLMLQYPNENSPVPVATGIEARMIEAENYLASGDAANFMVTLNAARTTVPGLAPLADPGDNPSRVNLLFRERAFWMYFTAHRLGDLRRMVRQYGMSVTSVYPTGSYRHGGVYGSDAVLLPAQSETNNPLWQAPAGRTEACTDKNP